MRVYLDHNATTPVREEVVEAMARALRERWGNPSSPHAEGSAARAELERARERVASLLGCAPREVLFTGSATEANNTALLGVLRARGGAPGQLVSSTIEHPSVEAPLAALEAEGWRVTRVGVDADGRVDPGEMADAITDDTALVSLIWANNETGVIQPVEELAELVKARGACLHVDATQQVGKLPIDLRRTPIDLLALTAHKFNGPKGVGCLLVRAGLDFESLLKGGPQERRRRGGTENVSGVVGLAVACELAERELPRRGADYARLRDRLWDGIVAKVPHVRRNGRAEHTLPNTLSVEFEGASGEVLLQALDLDGIAVSAGAACSSGSVEPSHVLVAMGRSPQQARATLRLSVGCGNDEAQIDRVLAVLPDLVARARDSETA